MKSKVHSVSISLQSAQHCVDKIKERLIPLRLERIIFTKSKKKNHFFFLFLATVSIIQK